MLRLHLPPNLANAAPRNAIAVRVEFDSAAAPDAGLLPALALLQRWCGTPKPPPFLQLTRAQLRELADALGSAPVFVDRGRVTAWQHDELVAEPAGTSTEAEGEMSDDASPVAGRPPGESPGPKSPSRNVRAVRAGTGPTVDGSEHFLAITLPSREDPAYDALLEIVRSSGFVLEPSNRRWWLRDRHRTLGFLATHGARLRGEFGAQFTPNFERNTARVREVRIECEVAAAGSDFDVSVALRAGAGGDDLVRAAVTANRAYVEVGDAIYLLDPATLRQLERAQQALAGTPGDGVMARRTQRVSVTRVAEAQEIIEAVSPGFQAPATWRERSEALRDLSRLEPAPLPPELKAQLRPYQRLGVAWLRHLHRHELGGILADEMGLGKTLQALALLSAVRAGGSALPSLVVCPASLLENWRRESARFTPWLRVFVHHGASRLGSPAEAAPFALIVTSYGTLTRDAVLFTAIDFDCIVADEAQHIKNRRSQNAAALRTLRARSRFLLTGTPMENSLDDLRSLFEFLLPGYLDRVPAGTRGDERAWYDERLKAKAAPYLLRRTKRAVAPELPPRVEQTLWCELTGAQAALYRQTQQRTERELFDLEAGGASEAKLRFAALTQLLRLRQICCDPRLVPASPEPGAAADLAAPAVDPAASSAVPYADSGKLEAFRELLAEAIDDGHRLLVFSQFTALLALLREELAAQDIAHCDLDGSMSPRARQAQVDRFQTSADVPVFLISLKAGGTGLNLTGADTVVHFDPWWNPAVEAQATDRAHRIGQKRVVTSYKLIASGTVEEKVLGLQAEKRALLAGVFEASDAVSAKLSLADLKSLLQ